MSLYKRQDSEVWFVSVTIKGKRIRKSTGTADKKEAQRIHDELKADLWQDQEASSAKTWHDAVIDWLNAAPRDPSDKYRIRNFSLPNAPLSSMTGDFISKHIEFENPGTYNRMVNLILAILNRAQKQGWIQTVPVILKRKSPPGRVRWLTREEWDRLFAELPPHQRDIASFAIATGLRQSNVLQLEWEQVDLEKKIAWIHPDQAKAKKAISVPLSDAAIEILKGQEGKSESHVFTYNGKPITEIKTAWKKALIRGGFGKWEKVGDKKRFVANLRWHDLRHTWATWHAQSGTPLEVLQKLGGWAEPKMVQRYAHFTPEYLAEFANNAKPYSKKSGHSKSHS